MKRKWFQPLSNGKKTNQSGEDGDASETLSNHRRPQQENS